MKWLDFPRYKLSLIGLLLFSIGLIVLMLVTGASSVEAARKKPPTRTPAATTAPTSTPQPTATPGSGPHWQVASIPEIGTVSRLRDAAVISTDDIWAVGQAGVSTLTMHWDGAAWSIVPSPNITGNGVQNDLRGVAAIAPDDVWAVGATVDPNISFGWKTLILHWDGAQWSIIPSPNLSEPGTCNSLQAVAAISSNDVWAVGYFVDNNGLSHALILQYK